MRQWKAGTLSLGLLLLVMGIGLLYSHFNQVAVLDFILKWWPILFILLGIEILASQALTRKGEMVLKYDVMSIFLIFIIVGGGICLQTLNETGLTQQIKEEVSAQYLEIDSEFLQAEVAKGISKIVVNAPNCELYTYTQDNMNVSASARISVNADNKQTAQDLINDSFDLKCNKVGNTLFVSFDTIRGHHGFGFAADLFKVTLMLPDNIDVDINSTYNDVVVDADINSNWEIDGEGDVVVKIPKNHNIQVNALVNTEDHLGGNVEWVMNHTTSSPNSALASYKTGTPTHHIDVCCNYIEVNHFE